MKRMKNIRNYWNPERRKSEYENELRVAEKRVEEFKAAEKLLESDSSLCPSCSTPIFKVLNLLIVRLLLISFLL